MHKIIWESARRVWHCGNLMRGNASLLLWCALMEDILMLSTTEWPLGRYYRPGWEAEVMRHLILNLGWRYLPATPSRNLGGAVTTIQVQSSHFIPNFERKIHSNTRHNAGWPLGRYYRPLIDNQPFCLNDWYSVLPPYIFWIWCRGVYFFGGRPDNCWL